MLDQIDYAESRGFIPVVDMERYPTHYNEPGDEAAAHFGTRNAWEYFFEQPAGLSLSAALERDPADNDGKHRDSGFVCFNSSIPYEDVLVRARELIQKYIRIKPSILEKVSSVLPETVHRDVLGVHVRGTDMRTGKHPAHAVPAPPRYYLDQAVQLDKEQGFRKIFLACDEVDTVDLFRSHFGERLIESGAHRTPADKETDIEYNWLFSKNERSHHRYLLGLEVLMDALLLARCGHMLFGLSNVPRSAMLFTEADQVRYEVPPIWVTPRHDFQPLGLSQIKEFRAPPRPPSPEAVAAHVEQLQQLLDSTERRVAEYAERWEMIRRTPKQLARTEKELANAKKIILRLQQRVNELVNGWTKLGWRLRPWKKPPWRHDPLKGCRLDTAESSEAGNS